MNRTKIIIIVASIPAAVARAQQEWETSEREKPFYFFHRTADCSVFVRNFLFVSLIPLNVALRVHRHHQYHRPPCTHKSVAVHCCWHCGWMVNAFSFLSSSHSLVRSVSRRVAVSMVIVWPLDCYLHRCFADILLEFVFSVAGFVFLATFFIESDNGGDVLQSLYCSRTWQYCFSDGKTWRCEF